MVHGSPFTVHGLRFTIRSPRFTVHDSQSVDPPCDSFTDTRVPFEYRSYTVVILKL